MKDIDITFVIENSQAMHGGTIGAINNAIEEGLVDIKDVAIHQNRKCNVSFITFSENTAVEPFGGCEVFLPIFKFC